MQVLVRRLAWTLAFLGGVALLVFATVTAIFCVQVRSNQTLDRRTAAPEGAEFVEAGDTRILVQRVGDRSAPAVLFVHGTGSWSGAWRTSMEQAAKLGWQAVAIDLPPFGYSYAPASGDYSKPAQARRIVAVLDALGIADAVFVGHSFGAAPLMEAVLAHPQRVRGVVLVDAALGLQRERTDGQTLPQKLAGLRWIGEPLSAAWLTNPAFTPQLLRAFISRKDRATADWVSLYRRPLYLQGTYEGVAAWLPQLLAGRGTAKSDDTSAYAALAVPVTLIWGETDTITPLAQGSHLKELIPASRLIPLPGAGHIPQIEDPAAFADALARALAAVQKS